MSVPHSRILGTGHYVPERVLTNQELEAKVDTSDEWIVSRTGIRERHIAAEGEVTSDMASEAAKRALAAAGIEATDLDLIVVATVTPDMPLPSTACFVQSKIGARRDCPSFDIAAPVPASSTASTSRTSSCARARPSTCWWSASSCSRG